LDKRGRRIPGCERPLTAGRALAMVASLLLFPGLLSAAQYHDPEGFSLVLPDTWVITAKLDREATLGATTAVTSETVRADASHTALLAYNPLPGHSDNVSVAVQNGSIRPNEQLRQELEASYPASLEKMGIAVASHSVTLARIGDRDVVSIVWSGTAPNLKEPIRQWQLMFPGWRKTYLVTFTASEKDYANMEPTFRGMAESFRAPKGMPNWATDFAIGLMAGATAALAAVIWWARRRKRRQPAPASDASTPGS
jgi:hypothetical protein